MNLWIMAGKNPGNLLTPAVTSSLGGTSITASNVTIRAASCFNAIRLPGKFKAAFERRATAALHADSGSPEEEKRKDRARCASMRPYLTRRQLGLWVLSIHFRRWTETRCYGLILFGFSQGCRTFCKHRKSIKTLRRCTSPKDAVRKKDKPFRCRRDGALKKMEH